MKENWEYSILQCIASFSGEAYLQDIYDKIGDFVELTEEHLKEQYRRPAYHNQIRSHIKNLCKSKDLILTSRACYSLTEKGRKRLIGEKPIEL